MDKSTSPYDGSVPFLLGQKDLMQLGANRDVIIPLCNIICLTTEEGQWTKTHMVGANNGHFCCLSTIRFLIEALTQANICFIYLLCNKCSLFL